jgi:hypothetical protein
MRRRRRNRQRVYVDVGPPAGPPAATGFEADDDESLDANASEAGDQPLLAPEDTDGGKTQSPDLSADAEATTDAATALEYTDAQALIDATVDAEVDTSAERQDAVLSPTDQLLSDTAAADKAGLAEDTYDAEADSLPGDRPAAAETDSATTANNGDSLEIDQADSSAQQLDATVDDDADYLSGDPVPDTVTAADDDADYLPSDLVRTVHSGAYDSTFDFSDEDPESYRDQLASTTGAADIIAAADTTAAAAAAAAAVDSAQRIGASLGDSLQFEQPLVPIAVAKKRGSIIGQGKRTSVARLYSNVDPAMVNDGQPRKMMSTYIDYVDEQLGDSFEDKPWLPPSAANALEFRASALYRGGKSSVWGTQLRELEDLGVGVTLYFKFLKFLIGVFTVLTLLAVPALLFSTSGAGMVSNQDVAGFYKGFISNIGLPCEPETGIVYYTVLCNLKLALSGTAAL